jgi:hypothetical protein
MNCVISIPRSVRELGIGSLLRFLASVAIVAARDIRHAGSASPVFRWPPSNEEESPLILPVLYASSLKY